VKNKKNKSAKKPEVAKKPESAKKQIPVNKIVNIIGLVLCILILPFMVINGTLFVQAIVQTETPPSFLGYTPLVIDTGSMSPEFEAGDLAVIKTTDMPERLRVGQIICYKTGKVYITHRIDHIEYADSGELMYVTKGDANNVPDTVRVAPSQILGVYEHHLDGVGSFVLFLQSPLGMATCVVLPAIALFAGFYFLERRKVKQLLQQAQEANK